MYEHIYINDLDYHRVPFSRTTIFMDFASFLFYTKTVSPKYNIYVRIHCDTEVLHGFIVIYRINMALLKYLKKAKLYAFVK